MNADVRSKRGRAPRPRSRWLLAATASLVSLAAPNQAAPNQAAPNQGAQNPAPHKLPKLRTLSGDFVEGEPASPPEGSALGWRSAAFAEPLGLEWHGLLRIEFPLFEGEEESTSARVTLRGGDRFYGDVTGFDGETLTLRSPRHGDLEIEAAAIERLDVLDSAQLLLDGIRDASRWTDPEGRAPERWALDGSALVGTGGEGQWILQNLPEESGPFEIDLAVQSDDAPRFRLVLAAPKELSALQRGFSFEIMSVGLVVHRQVAGALEYQKTETPSVNGLLECRIRVDPERGTVQVLAGGKEILRFEDQRDLDQLGHGLMLESRCPKLSVQRLRVLRGGAMEEQGPRVAGLDEVVSIDAERRVTMRSGDQSQPLSFWESLLGLATGDGAAEPAPAAPRTVRFSYYDGGSVSGLPVRSTDRGVELKVAGLHEPVLAPWPGSVRLDVEERVPYLPDSGASALIEAEGLRLSGQLVGGEGPTPVHFRPAHSSHAVPLELDSQMRVSLNQRPPAVAAERLEDELHLRNGDVVPCRILAATPGELSLVMADGIERKVDRSKVKAVIFQRSSEGKRDVAEGARTWRGRAAEKQGDTVRLVDGDLCSTPLEVAHSCRMLFDLEFEEPSGLVLVGLAENGAQPNYSRHLSIGFYRTAAGLSSTVMEVNPPSGMVRMGAPQDSAGARGGDRRRYRIEVRLDTETGRCQVFADGEPLAKGSLEARPPLRLAQMFCAVGSRNSLSRNGMFLATVNDPIGAGKVGAVRLGNLRALDWGGDLPEAQLERITTRRRGESQDEVRDVLRATNGDLLRGRLVGLDEEGFHWKSRSNTLVVPRSRVVEWIDLAPDPATEWQRADPLTVVMAGGHSLSLTPLSCDEKMLVGRSTVLGDCSVHWWDAVSLHTSARTGSDATEFEDWVQREPHPLPDESCETPAPLETAPKVEKLLGKQAPAFDLARLDGERVALSALKGKVVVLQFFATWNQPSTASLPLLAEALAEFDESQVAWWCIDQGEDGATLRRFLSARSLDLPILVDSQGTVARDYEASVLPRTVVIGPDGRVREVFVGIAQVGSPVADAVRAVLPR